MNNQLIQFGLLKKDLKATLANNICNVQSLDIAADRNQVLKELLKMLSKNYEITKLAKPYKISPMTILNKLPKT